MSRRDRERARRAHPWRWTEFPEPVWDVRDGRRAFISATDRAYRVYDRCVVDGKAVTVSLGDPAARYRVFVNERADRWRYVFTTDGAHDTTPMTLQLQLTRAKRLPA